MQTIPEISRLHSVRLTVMNNWGSGILWKTTEPKSGEKLIVLTCKHNLCTSGTPCNVNCGSNCKKIASIDNVTLITSLAQVRVTKIQVAEAEDFAVLNLSYESVGENSFSNLNIHPITSFFFKQSAYFKGFPSILSDFYNLEKSHLFDGFISDINSQKNILDFRSLATSNIEEIRGVSGSGLIIADQNGKYWLAGIVTDYKGLNSFICFNPYTVLKSWNMGSPVINPESPAISKIRGHNQWKITKIEKEIDRLMSEIERFDTQIERSFQAELLSEQKRELISILEQKIEELKGLIRIGASTTL